MANTTENVNVVDAQTENVEKLPKKKGFNKSVKKVSADTASTSSAPPLTATELGLDNDSILDFLSKNVLALQKRMNEQDNVIEHLQARVASLEEELSKAASTSGGKKDKKLKKLKELKELKEKKTREPTAYNIFMKTKLTELKETHKDLSNIERMKLAAEAWTESKK